MEAHTRNMEKNRLQTVTWPVKLSFLFALIISIGFLVKHFIPYIIILLISTLPGVWFSFKTLLSPFCLFIFLNSIIIIIAISSNIQNKTSEKKKETKVANSQKKNQGNLDRYSAIHQKISSEFWSDISFPITASAIYNEDAPDSIILRKKLIESSPENLSCISSIVNSPDSYPAHRQTRETSPTNSSDASCLTDSDERYPMSSNIMVKQRKEKSLMTASNCESVTKRPNTLKTKEHQSIGSRRKAYCERRPKSLLRNERPSPIPAIESEHPKSEPFNDAASIASSRSSSSNGERSLSRDELNKRVEAFIKKFNDDIRLQKQNSYRRKANRRGVAEVPGSIRK